MRIIKNVQGFSLIHQVVKLCVFSAVLYQVTQMNTWAIKCNELSASGI